MVSVASGGAADRIAMRILLKVLRAGSGIPARYSSTFFGAPLAFAAELGPPDFTFFMPEMLQKLPLQVHPQPPYVPKSSHRGSPDYALYRQTATESVEPQCHHGVHARRTSCRHPHSIADILDEAFERRLPPNVADILFQQQIGRAHV